jgi:formate dehydrogenase iron-sulfur subunit
VYRGLSRRGANHRPAGRNCAQAHARAREIGGYVYGEHENGGTNTLYVSPVPFETINAAIAKGPGQPHLGPVEDRMADANHMGAALLIAPLAGAATALGRYLKAARRAGQSGPDDRLRENANAEPYVEKGVSHVC